MAAVEMSPEPSEWSEEYIEATRRVILTPASKIKPQPVKWLWADRLALGTLALLAGREGGGKTSVAIDTTARLTRGTLPGEFFGQPRDVLIGTTEDDWAFTIVPRLIAAGADLDRVHRIEVETADRHTALMLPRDLRGLRDAAKSVSAVLFIMDPLMSRLGSLDTHRDSEVRQALEPLVDTAASVGMSVWGLIHHNKTATSDPLQAVMGSRAFTAVARSVHTVLLDPDDEARRIFGSPKNNLGRSDLPSMVFRLVEVEIPTDEGPAKTSRIDWTGESAGSITETMQRATDSPEDRTKSDEAADWLLNHLEANGGTDDSASVKEAAKNAKHSLSALQRARGQLGVETTSEGFPRRTFWSLPGTQSSSRSNSLGERDE